MSFERFQLITEEAIFDEYREAYNSLLTYIEALSDDERRTLRLTTPDIQSSEALAMKEIEVLKDHLANAIDPDTPFNAVGVVNLRHALEQKLEKLGLLP
ncbi:MAG: hypothetical protein AAGA35_03280 [Patescibacteria group bacterium]